MRAIQVQQIHSRYQLLKSIYRLNVRMGLLHAMQGVDISRCFEYTEAYLRMAPVAGEQILDIGSYRSPFPAFLIQRGCHVSLIDIDRTVARQKRWIARAVGIDARSLVVVGDGTRLPYPSESFDCVTCISTIEHLPGDGDINVAKEIGRVLRAEGRAFISVPYAPVMREGKWGKWPQRWYDIPGAFSRLVDSYGFTLLDYGFLLGGVAGKIADAWYALPRLIRHSLSWMHIAFFPSLFRRDTADWADARVLWLLVIKQM